MLIVHGSLTPATVTALVDRLTANVQGDIQAIGSDVEALQSTVTSFFETPDIATYLARDRFIDTNGTTLAAHAPDIGDPWTVYSSVPVIQGQAILGGLGTGAAVQGVGAVEVEAVAHIVLGTSGGAGVIVRAVDSANYWFAWIEVSAKQLRIYRVTAGASAVMGSLATPTIAVGNKYILRVHAFGSHIVAEIAGVGILQWDDVPVTGAGVGIRIGGGSTANLITQFAARADPAPTIPSLPTITATNAATPLVLPVMYGDTQGTHPDVIDFGTIGWQGYRYWMTWTPHTGGDTRNENPSMTVSQDGINWTTPPGLTNPIIPWPGGVSTFNSDPDMVFLDDTLYLLYRTSSTTFERLSIVESQDGVTWSDPVPVIDSITTSVNQLVSPALVYRYGRWHMWSITTSSPTRYRMEYRTAPSIYGPWSEPHQCVMPMPSPTIDMWHINVLDVKTKLVGVFSSGDRTQAGSGIDGNLYYAESYDGINWNLAATPFLFNTADGTSWDDAKLYRSAVVKTATGYDLFYSAYGTDAKWHVARTAMTLS